MKTKHDRFALIPIRCTECRRYIWLERYRKAEINRVITPYFPGIIKRRICNDCISDWVIELTREEETEAEECMEEAIYCNQCKYYEGVHGSPGQAPCTLKKTESVMWNEHCDKQDKIIKALEQEPCEDCISRQAIDTLVDELARAISDERCCMSRGRSTATIMQDILDLPPVTPKPKTVLYSGDGYADGYMVYDMAECPNCGYKYEEGDKDWGLSFCPNCGQSLNWESEVQDTDSD